MRKKLKKVIALLSVVISTGMFCALPATAGAACPHHTDAEGFGVWPSADFDFDNSGSPVSYTSKPIIIFYPVDNVCSICGGHYNTAGSDSPSTYAWDFGNGSTGTGQSASCSYSTPAAYNVSLTVGGSGYSTTVTKKIASSNDMYCHRVVVPDPHFENREPSLVSGPVLDQTNATWNYTFAIDNTYQAVSANSVVCDVCGGLYHPLETVPAGVGYFHNGLLCGPTIQFKIGTESGATIISAALNGVTTKSVGITVPFCPYSHDGGYYYDWRYTDSDIEAHPFISQTTHYLFTLDAYWGAEETYPVAVTCMCGYVFPMNGYPLWRPCDAHSGGFTTGPMQLSPGIHHLTIGEATADVYIPDHSEGDINCSSSNAFGYMGEEVQIKGIQSPDSCGVISTDPIDVTMNGTLDQVSLNGSRITSTQIYPDADGKFSVTVAGLNCGGSAVVSFTTQSGKTTTCNFEWRLADDHVIPHAYADMIDTYNGKLSFSVTDINLPGKGPMINFTRKYTTRPGMDLYNVNDIWPMDSMGCWQHSYNVYLRDLGVGINVSRMGNNDWYPLNGLVYERPRAVYAQLTKIDSFYKLTEKDGTIYCFAQHNVVKDIWMLSYIEDRHGNRTTLQYDNSNQLLIAVYEGVDPQTSRKITLGYTDNKLTSLTDPKGRVIQYVYNSDGNLTEITGPEGYDAIYVYAQKPSTQYYMSYCYDTHLPKGSVGKRFTYEYVGNGVEAGSGWFADKIMDNNGGQLLRVDYAHRLDAITDQYVSVYNGNDQKVSEYWYAFGAWSKTRSFIDSGTHVYTNVCTWDTDYNQTSFTDNIGRMTTNTFDHENESPLSHSNGNKTSTSLALTNMTVISYFEYENAANYFNLKRRIDPMGNITGYIYFPNDTTHLSNRGNLMEVHSQNPNLASTYNDLLKIWTENTITTTSYTYNECGQKASETVCFGGDKYATTNYTYDPITGLLASVIAPSKDGVEPGMVTTIKYDIMGLKTETTDGTVLTGGTALTTKHYYDNDDRLTRTEYPDGTIVSNDYDSKGNLWKVTDQNGHITQKIFDVRDRVTDIFGEEGSHTVYEYDNNNNVTKTTISRQNGDVVTDYEYDNLNRVTATTDYPANGARRSVLAYDAVGRKEKITKANGDTVEYTYYDENDQVKTEIGKNSLNNVQYSNAYEYNFIGKLTKMTDAVTITENAYDNMYRIKKATVNRQDNAIKTATEYTYDLARVINKKCGKVVDGALVDGQYMNTDYEYYDNGWLKQQTDDGKRTSYDYYPTSEKKIVTYPNNTETFCEYNCYNTNPGNLTVLKNHYLKKMTNRSSDSRKATISSFEYTYDPAGQRLTMKELRGATTYQYDNLYRLSFVKYPDLREVTYSYDKTGNRTRMYEKEWNLVRGDWDTKETLYTYDQANQHLTSTCTAVTTVTSTTTTSNTWDANGNMQTKTVGADTTTYTWDALNRLTQIDYPTSTSKVSSTMKYDGNGIRVQQTSSSGTINYVFEGLSSVLELDESGNITKKYHSGIFMEIPEVTGGAKNSCKQTYYYLYDGLGDVVNLTDDAGNIDQTYYYDSYGRTTNVKHDCVNKKQFTGKEIDEDSGLYYFCARYYDPEVGRFLSEDPVPYANLYVYCDNNPINKVDPDGRAGVDPYITPDKLVKEINKNNQLNQPNPKTANRPDNSEVYRGPDPLSGSDEESASRELAVKAIEQGPGTKASMAAAALLSATEVQAVIAVEAIVIAAKVNNIVQTFDNYEKIVRINNQTAKTNIEQTNKRIAEKKQVQPLKEDEQK